MAIDINSTPADLKREIKSTRSSNVMIAAIRHFNALSLVLFTAINYAKNTENETAVYLEIINNNNAESDVLCELLLKTKDSKVMIEAIKSPKSDKKVLQRAIVCAKNTENETAVYLEIIKKNDAESDVLCNLLSKTNDSNVMIEAIKSPKSDEKVLQRATVCAKNTGNETAVYLEIIRSKAITPGILCELLLKTNDSNVMIEIIKSPMASVKVLERATSRATYTDNEMAVKNAVNTILSQSESLVHLSIATSEKTKNTEEVNDLIEESEIMVEKEDNVTERIRRNVEDGMSSMLWGLPGIGKTARVKKVDPTYTMIKLKNGMLPEEVTGGKEPNGEPGQMYPPKWYVKLCEKCEKEPDRMHILFIDELTNVKDSVKTLVWDIIEDRRVNGDEDWTLPENCAIVAAGNRPEESTAVQTDYNGGVLPEPLHDRFDFHIEIPLDMQEWQLWALETNPKTGNLNIHPTVLSFCASYADSVMFTNFDATKITQPRLSPRRWEKLSKAIYMAEKRGGKNCHVSDLRIEECIGSSLAPAFIAHYQKTPINMNWVEQGKYSANDFKNIQDKLFALGSLIAEYKGDPMCVEDFIATCLGEDYVVLYNVMKKRREETLLNAAKASESEKIEKVNFAKHSA